MCVVTKQYKELKFTIHPDMLAELFPNAITEACATFPGDTGLGHDNISPRAVQCLSPQAIKALSIKSA